MEKPLELTIRNIAKLDGIEELVREKLRKLERICDHITSCQVTLNRPQEHQETGSPYQVLIEVRVPPKHDVVVKREPGDLDMHDTLEAVIRDAFDAMSRQLHEIVEKQRKEVKIHPRQETNAIVSELHPGDGYGFLSTVDGRSIYFHRNAVLHNEYDRLTAGTAVRFAEELGEKGPQASTVQIVDRPGT